MTLRIEIKNWLKSQSMLPAANTLAELREQVNQSIIQQQGIERDSSYQHSFTVMTEDQAEIEVRVYVPYILEHVQQRPAMVFAHGGGWCLGSLDAWDRACRLLAEATVQVIFSVDYRLTPEVKFPIPLTDFFSALSYIQKNASTFGLDQNRIAVGGDSAGANIAAAACLLAKQHPDIKISHQLLFYPALDATMKSPSYETYAQGFGLTSSTMAYCWDQYLNTESDKVNELVSPLLAHSLQDLPDATIFVCEYDPLRQDGEKYAEQLRAAGVNVKFHVLEGMIHGAIHMLAITAEAKSIYAKAAF
ncbi:alpha/beta hydrolase [Acinetobacter sp. ANC 3882]|uniref:alpha/beta hydrolase n=1 Tax=Acinetobacter sp. ANC 3882 TaxID=2923423 RepID=UPI001F4AAB5D|nr:alpha/beta hydrolase [Acinetobacter sp. ANC 3882]MCH7313085.1 alpha/beta hydrolase [Acinetobacter sp. ANC 3882]